MGYTKKVSASAEEVDNTVDKTTDEKQIRKFEPTDLITCRSMVSGGLYIEGSRSQLLYSWADYGDENEIEYRDLIYMVRTNGNKNIYEPRIIVEDEEFIEQNPKLAEFYESLYTTKDLKDILKLPVEQMKDVVSKLPIGNKNALKGIVSTMIDDGRIDSVKKIQALDEIFGTNMLLTLVKED